MGKQINSIKNNDSQLNCVLVLSTLHELVLQYTKDSTWYNPQYVVRCLFFFFSCIHPHSSYICYNFSKKQNLNLQSRN